jgi:hypothetical protein
MLTKFDSFDTLKMKFTVIMIWFIAIIISLGMFFLLKERAVDVWIRIGIGTVVAFSLLAIVLRCKVGRWFTLLGVYTYLLFPIMISLIPIFLLPDRAVIPIDMEQALIHLLIGGMIIYFMSNKESMEIFYIHFNLFEHLFFIFLGTVLIALDIYYFRIFFS